MKAYKKKKDSVKSNKQNPQWAKNNERKGGKKKKEETRIFSPFEC